MFKLLRASLIQFTFKHCLNQYLTRSALNQHRKVNFYSKTNNYIHQDYLHPLDKSNLLIPPLLPHTRNSTGTPGIRYRAPDKGRDRNGFAIGAKVDARFHAMSFWRGMAKNEARQPRERKGEGRRGADWGREKSVRKGSGPRWIKASLGLFTQGLYLSPVLYGLRLKNRSTDHVPTFLLGSHSPCPSTLPFIINCFVRSLSSVRASFKVAPLRNAIEKYHPEKFHFGWYLNKLDSNLVSVLLLLLVQARGKWKRMFRIGFRIFFYLSEN